MQKSGDTTAGITEVKPGMDGCFSKAKTLPARLFTRYGEFVGTHPVPFIILPILILGVMGIGLVAMELETDLEKVYFPMGSRALKDRERVRDLFPDLNSVAYNPFSQSEADQALDLIFVSKTVRPFKANAVSEMQSIVDRVKTLTATENGRVLAFSDVCAKSNSECVVSGEFILSPSFQTTFYNGAVSFPFWNGRDLRSYIADVRTTSRQFLISVRVIKVSFKLAWNLPALEKVFQDFAANLSTKFAEVSYGTPNSLNEELDKSTKGDIFLFSLTIGLCCTYASVVTSGGNPVSTRGMLALGGQLASGLSILGSMGLLCAFGVKFVNIIGVIPFLVIGIGIDDMFLMMSCWSERLPSVAEEKTVRHVPRMLGQTLAGAGIGITITSLTDFLAFVIGTTSVFRSVTNFSLYAGVAVLFCYLANVTLFSGCLALHGRRVYSSRHAYTFMKTKSALELAAEGRNRCISLVCGGTPPEGPRADESLCEKLPRLCLPKIFTRKPVCIMIIVAFLGYIAVAIYGVVHLPQGLVLKNLVSEDSYYHRFLSLEEQHFPTALPIGFIVDAKMDYSATQGQEFLDLLAMARQNSKMNPTFERCWLGTYRNSSFHDASSPRNFVTNLQAFLSNRTDFARDVILDNTNTSSSGGGQATAVLASRCFLLSDSTSDQYAMADLMQEVRALADASSLPSVFAYHSAFVAYEQFIAVLPATLQMVGCAVLVMTIITAVMLPHPLMVFLVILTVVMILTGILGFLTFWDLTLSSITMIHLVMSVGFSVDFSAHVCAAYLVSPRGSRRRRAEDALTHAGGPILNGAVSTLLGVVLLGTSSSYVFFSFFKIMMLVLGFGLLHAVFFLPAVLTLVGPQNAEALEEEENEEERSSQQEEQPDQNQAFADAAASKWATSANNPHGTEKKLISPTQNFQKAPPLSHPARPESIGHKHNFTKGHQPSINNPKPEHHPLIPKPDDNHSATTPSESQVSSPFDPRGVDNYELKNIPENSPNLKSDFPENTML